MPGVSVIYPTGYCGGTLCDLSVRSELPLPAKNNTEHHAKDSQNRESHHHHDPGLGNERWIAWLFGLRQYQRV